MFRLHMPLHIQEGSIAARADASGGAFAHPSRFLLSTLSAFDFSTFFVFDASHLLFKRISFPAKFVSRGLDKSL
jgi:hypothetical protein